MMKLFFFSPSNNNMYVDSDIKTLKHFRKHERISLIHMQALKITFSGLYLWVIVC